LGESNTRELITTQTSESWIFKNETWVITNSEEIVDQTKVLDTSIKIEANGELLIQNSILQIDSAIAPIGIIIEKGGELKIFDSNLTAYNISEDKGYSILVYGAMTINNSEFYHLCSETGVSQLETCGGVTYQNRYSSGIEIYSDDVQIMNSKFEYASNTSILISKASPKIENNIFSNNIKAIYIEDSKITIMDNDFESNYFAIETIKGEVTYINNTFYGNLEINVFSEETNVEIFDSRFYYGNILLFAKKGTVLVENSTFYDGFSVWFEESDVHIHNSSFSNTREATVLQSSTAVIKNNILESCELGIRVVNGNTTIIEDNIIKNSTYLGLEVWSSVDLTVKNNSILNCRNGINLFDSEIWVTDNTIKDSTYLGIGDYSQDAIIKNNLISNNALGIGLFYSKSLVFNNTIIRNEIGIISHSSTSDISNNIIADNLKWGLNISNIDPQLSGNIYQNEEYPANGLGRITRNAEIQVRVKDTKDNEIRDTTITVYDEDKVVFIEQTYGASGEFFIPVYQISNLGEKKNFNPYTVSASWGSESTGYTITSRSFEAESYEQINLTLQLPDIYVSKDDIEISKSKLKHGDTVEFKVTIHYIGTQIPAKDINVTLTVDGGIIKRFPVSFNASSGVQNLTIPIKWKVVAFKSGNMTIRVNIDRVNQLENHQLDYEDNNIASTEITVEGKELQDAGVNLNNTQICGLFLIIVTLLIIIIVSILYKLKMRTIKKYEQEILGRENRVDGPKQGESADRDEITEKGKTPEDELSDSDKIKGTGGRTGKRKRMDKGNQHNSGKTKVEKNKKNKENKIEKVDGIKKGYNKDGSKKTMKEKLTEDLNKDVPPRIKW
jgi:parallel beta-helix repeat protein